MKLLLYLLFYGIDIFCYFPQNRIRQINKCKSDVKVLKNIKYGDNKYCLLDMYVPKIIKDKYKVLINIHGGGFIAGNKNNRKYYGYYFSLKSNNIVINLEYPKSPKYSQLESIKYLSLIYDFLLNNKDKYKFDLDNVSIMGDSSGAHYALFLSNLAYNEELKRMFNFDTLIKPVNTILLSGLYDFNLESDIKLFKDGLKELKKMVMDKPSNKILNPVDYCLTNKSKFFIGDAANDILCKGQTDQMIKRVDVNYELFKTFEKNDIHAFALFYSSSKGREFVDRAIELIK